MTAPLTGTKQSFTYARIAGRGDDALPPLLADLGVAKGDRVILYMPMIPQAAFAMLACARIGAIHSVVFGGFAPPNSPPASTMPSRSSSCRLLAVSSPGASSPTSRLLDKAIELAAHKPDMHA